MIGTHLRNPSRTIRAGEIFIPRSRSYDRLDCQHIFAGTSATALLGIVSASRMRSSTRQIWLGCRRTLNPTYSRLLSRTTSLLSKNLFPRGTNSTEHYTGFEWNPGPGNGTRLPINALTLSPRAVRNALRVDRDIRAAIHRFPSWPASPASDRKRDRVALGYRASPRIQGFRFLSRFTTSTISCGACATRPTTCSAFFANNLAPRHLWRRAGMDYQIHRSMALHGGYDLLKNALHVKSANSIQQGAHERKIAHSNSRLRSLLVDFPPETRSSRRELLLWGDKLIRPATMACLARSPALLRNGSPPRLASRP